MTGGVLVLLLVAALCHALWNIAAKSGSAAGGNGYVFVWWYQTVSLVALAPISIVVLARSGWPLPPALLYAPIVSGVLHIGYGLILQKGYARAELGIVYPVARGTGPMLTMLVAVLLLGERPGLLALLGGLVVVAGIAVVTSGELSRARRGAPTVLMPGLLYGTATGLTIAAYTVWDDHTMTSTDLNPIVYFTASTVWQSLLMAPGLRSRRAHVAPTLRRTWKPILVIAALSPLAYVLVLIAMQTTPVALVAPVRESSIVVGALLAWWLFGERDVLRRLLGAVVVVAGIALVAVG